MQHRVPPATDRPAKANTYRRHGPLCVASPICLMLLVHASGRGRTHLLDGGDQQAMRMAMIAITTSNSISVNPALPLPGASRMAFPFMNGEMKKDMLILLDWFEQTIRNSANAG